MNEYIKKLLVFNPLRESIIRSAIRELGLSQGSRGLDAGCGIGLQALRLTEAVGPAGQVTGLDISPEMLDYAGEQADQAGLSDRISFQAGDIHRLPFEDNSFDWAWSMDCVGYAPIDPLPPLRELLRVVKPGGKIALLAWSSEKLLPGYPQLEARLNATTSGIAPFVKGKDPALHFARALGWFRRIGLQNPQTRTFCADVQAPLSETHQAALKSLFEMRWVKVKPELSPEDLKEYQLLCLPDSPNFILNHPDYYAFFTYSMFFAEAPE